MWLRCSCSRRAPPHPNQCGDRRLCVSRVDVLSVFGCSDLLPAAGPRGGHGAGDGVAAEVFRVVVADMFLGDFGFGTRARFCPARRRSLLARLRRCCLCCRRGRFWRWQHLLRLLHAVDLARSWNALCLGVAGLMDFLVLDFYSANIGLTAVVARFCPGRWRS